MPGLRRSQEAPPRRAARPVTLRDLSRGLAPGLAGREDGVRPVLRRLHVRLVEGVDAEDRPGDRGRELPAEELGAEVVRIVEPHRPVLAVGPRLGILAGRGHEPFPLLPSGLRDQLLGPEPEPAGRLVDADLVAALAPALAELKAEGEARILLAEPAPLGPSSPRARAASSTSRSSSAAGTIPKGESTE